MKYSDIEISQVIEHYKEENRFVKPLKEYAYFNDVVGIVKNSSNTLNKKEIEDGIAKLVFPVPSEMKGNGEWERENDGIDFHFWTVVSTHINEIDLRLRGQWEMDYKSTFDDKKKELDYILDNTFPKGGNTSKWEDMEHIENGERLVLGIFSEESDFSFDDLNDKFPDNIKSIKVSIKWASHPVSWHTERFQLTYFWSTILDRYLEYPKTYKDLYSAIEMIIAEHFKLGTIGLDDGNFNEVAYQGMGKMFGLVGDILNCGYIERKKLPVFER